MNTIQNQNAIRRFIKSDEVFSYLLIIPALIIIALVVVYPVILVFRMSLSEISLKGNSIQTIFHGLKTFKKIFSTETFLITIKNSLEFAFFSVTIGMVLSFILTLALNKISIGVKIFRTIILFPWIAPLVVSGMMWKWVLSDIFGIFNYFLINLNIIDSPINWVGNPLTAMKTVIWADIWAFTPFCVIILYAGLQQIPK
jgi:multiple sugar transport system permease protein